MFHKYNLSMLYKFVRIIPPNIIYPKIYTSSHASRDMKQQQYLLVPAARLCHVSRWLFCVVR